MTNKIILALEAEQMTKEIPTFASGTIVNVSMASQVVCLRSTA